jgi:four helix bundle protein
MMMLRQRNRPLCVMSLESVAAQQAAWERSCHDAITSDVIWRLDAYRASLFLLDLARADAKLVAKRSIDGELAGQLLHSVASVSANLGEGFSRSSRADRLRFLDYSLSSDREALAWYYAASDLFPAETTDDRLILIARIRSLRLGLIRSTRARARPRFEP